MSFNPTAQRLRSALGRIHHRPAATVPTAAWHPAKSAPPRCQFALLLRPSLLCGAWYHPADFIRLREFYARAPVTCGSQSGESAYM